MSILAYTYAATNIRRTTAVGHGCFIGGSACWAVFEVKKGLGGTIFTEAVSYYKTHPDEPFSANITNTPWGLSSDSTYYYRTRVSETGLPPYYYGEWVEFHTLAWEVFTEPATNITDNSGTMNGYFDGDWGCWSGFEWKKGLEGSVTFEGVGGGMFKQSPGVPFSFNLLVLDSGEVYYYRTRININPTGVDYRYGPWIGFITGESLAITYPATNVRNHLATLNGSIIQGFVECVENGFEWREESASVINKVEVSSGPGDITTDLVSLSLNTLHRFRAYGKKSTDVMFYGEWLYFTTTNEVPTVTTQIATDLEALSATGNGTVISINGGEIYCSRRGFDIEYEFSGTLEEYHAWQSHGFEGDIVLDDETGLWSGTIMKSYEETGIFFTGVFTAGLDDLVCGKTYNYMAKAENTAGWGYGSRLEFTTDELLLRKACTLGIWTILLCAYVKPIPSGSVIKRRGFRWGIYETAQEYDIHEDGDFSANATIGPVDTISFVCSNDDNIYDTIVDSSNGFVVAGFVAGKFINVSATGAHSIENEGQFKIISVSEDGGTIEVSVRNTLVSEAVTGVTIVDLFALYIVDLDPETDYYSVAYVAIEDSGGNWTVQEGDVASATTIVNPFDFEGYDKVEYYKPDRAQNYKKITRKIEAEIVAEQQYIEKAGGRRILDIRNHLIQTKANAILIGTSYKDRFKNIKSIMGIEYPTPAPLQREDTLDIGFGRIRFKEDGKGVVNFMPDGEGLMLFRYRMIMMIRKIDMGYIVSKDDVDYVATMELEEA